jgi:hypothetical protein
MSARRQFSHQLTEVPTQPVQSGIGPLRRPARPAQRFAASCSHLFSSDLFRAIDPLDDRTRAQARRDRPPQSMPIGRTPSVNPGPECRIAGASDAKLSALAAALAGRKLRTERPGQRRVQQGSESRLDGVQRARGNRL